MGIFGSIKKFIQRAKLKNLALVAVIVSQSLKRIVRSELGSFVLDIIPIPWASLVGKILNWASKVEKVVPEVIKAISITKGILTEDQLSNDKLVMAVFIDHLRYYSHDQLNEFIKFFAIQIMNASSDDGIIDEEEKDQMVEEAYQFLFKMKK